jgi:hypothetical protein
MPQWHAPCWRRVLPCPGGPRAAYCAASFIWFCLSQWPLFRDLARSGRQGQSDAAQNKSCFAFCFPGFLCSGMAVYFWPARRPSPRKMPRPLTRSFFQPRKTRSMKSQSKICSSDYDEIKVPGGFVDWRYCRKIVKEYRFPTVVRISRTKIKGEYYKSVHAAKNIPAKKMIGLYLGAVVETCRIRDGRWCVVIPCHRGDRCLDSKITKDWPWERYLLEGAVGGFFNSSRKIGRSTVTNHRDANCKIEWFFENTGINGGRVYAALFTKRSVRAGCELLWDYNWL